MIRYGKCMKKCLFANLNKKNKKTLAQYIVLWLINRHNILGSGGKIECTRKSKKGTGD